MGFDAPAHRTETSDGRRGASVGLKGAAEDIELAKVWGRLKHKVSVSNGVVEGFAYDPDTPSQCFVVELRVDGFIEKVQIADLLVPSLPQSEEVNRKCGFRFTAAGAEWAGRRLEVRLANSDIALSETPSQAPDADSFPGHVRWSGGLRLAGWIPGSPDGRARKVRICLGGIEIAAVEPSFYAHVKDQAVPAFDFHLPERFADGDLHEVSVETEDGVPLEGSPIPIVAYPDGLRALLVRRPPAAMESLRAELYDRLVPQSLPFSQLDDWMARFPIAAAPKPTLTAVALVGDGAVDASIESLVAQSDCHWVAVQLESRPGSAKFEAEDLLEFLDGAGSQADVVVFARAGTRFLPGGLALLASQLTALDRFAYADVVAMTESDEALPLAWPDFSYERLLEQGYPASLFALPKAAAVAAAKAGCADLYALLFSALDGTAGEGARHRPGFSARVPPIDREEATALLARAAAAHLDGRRIAAEAAPSAAGTILPCVWIKREPPPTTFSVIVPTRDRVDLLRVCLESCEPAFRRARAEVLIVDNDSQEEATRDYLRAREAAGDSVIAISGPFNYSRMNNLAARRASGSALLFLNNDVEARDADWLDELAGRLSEPDVGAVGAMLVWPSGVVQHGGVVLGPKYAAAHAFTGRIEDDPGYADMLCVARETSAVTGACLATRKAHFVEVGGFDEIRFPVNFNDVDYCLKQGRAGRRVVWTPHARLVHRESSTRGADLTADGLARFSREIAALRERWSPQLTADPYYSPLLALDGVAPYSALGWPPRTQATAKL